MARATVVLAALWATAGCGVVARLPYASPRAPSGNAVVPPRVCTIDCDWLGYLANASHTSSSHNDAIRLTDVAHLASHWHFFPRAGKSPVLYATPATWHNTVFVAGDNGVLAALDMTTGAQLWAHDFGFVAKKTCSTGQGIVASPAVRDDGTGNPLVYVNSPDGYLYEIKGTTGATVWRSLVQVQSPTKNDSYAWSSPAVYGGRVYVGISSQCDTPFVRGAVKSYDAVTGVPIATFWTLPSGFIGAGVWTSPAADATGVYLTTGSTTGAIQKAHPPTVTNAFDQYSVLRLDNATLKPLGKWPAPVANFGDPDFGSSPVLFRATIKHVVVPMVGACNKDGYFYALRSDTMQLVWKRLVGTKDSEGTVGCFSGGVWDGVHLFVAGNKTTIAGRSVPGSVRKLDPATGLIRWETALTANPLGAGSINGNNVLAYGGTDWANGPGNGVFLIDAKRGKIVRTLPEAGNFPEFAQPIWAGNHLFTTKTDELVEWSR